MDAQEELATAQQELEEACDKSGIDIGFKTANYSVKKKRKGYRGLFFLRIPTSTICLGGRNFEIPHELPES